MIAYLRGNVLRLTPEIVVLDVNGVGYLLAITASARDRMPSVGAETELHVYTQVREDALALYGFYGRGDVSAFQDDAYGPTYDGYLGPGPLLNLAARQGPFIRDEARHCLRDQVAGCHGVHGRPGLHHAPSGATQQHRQCTEASGHNPGVVPARGHGLAWQSPCGSERAQ